MTWEEYCANHRPSSYSYGPTELRRGGDMLTQLLTNALHRLDQLDHSGHPRVTRRHQEETSCGLCYRTEPTIGGHPRKKVPS